MVLPHLGMCILICFCTGDVYSVPCGHALPPAPAAMPASPREGRAQPLRKADLAQSLAAPFTNHVMSGTSFNFSQPSLKRGSHARENEQMPARIDLTHRNPKHRCPASVLSLQASNSIRLADHLPELTAKLVTMIFRKHSEPPCGEVVCCGTPVNPESPSGAGWACGASGTPKLAGSLEVVFPLCHSCC